MSSTAKRVLRNIALVILIYSIVMAIYFAALLSRLNKPLAHLFEESLWAYALAALLLILVQATILEGFSSFLVDRLGLEKPE